MCVNAHRVGSRSIVAWTVTPRFSSSACERRPSSSSPSAVKRCASSPSSASWIAATPAAPSGLLPVLDGVRDLARRRMMVDAREPDPLHVPDDGDLHGLQFPRTRLPFSSGSGLAIAQVVALQDLTPTESAERSHAAAVRSVSPMMAAVAIPPFETFYVEHRSEVLGLLRKKLGRDRAEDAFQETFLRALRAYGRLEHGEHLRAWVLTIASRVAIDAHRRTRAAGELPELAHEDARPAYEDLGELTDGLPPKERAAVVLRYGYDLTYDQIAAALDSSPEAARQAASTGVRRLRKEKTR